MLNAVVGAQAKALPFWRAFAELAPTGCDRVVVVLRLRRIDRVVLGAPIRGCNFTFRACLTAEVPVVSGILRVLYSRTFR